MADEAEMSDTPAQDEGQDEGQAPTPDTPPTVVAPAAAAAAPARPGAPQQGPRVRWVTDELKSSYANVCTMSSTREEVVLTFGVNHEWDRQSREMAIALTHRVILSPFAAQRMLESLQRLMQDYQSKHGTLKADEPAVAPRPAGTS